MGNELKINCYGRSPTKGNCGINVEWNIKSHKLIFSGWYDKYCEFGGKVMDLSIFLKKLGINREDCDEAYAKIIREA